MSVDKELSLLLVDPDTEVLVKDESVSLCTSQLKSRRRGYEGVVAERLFINLFHIMHLSFSFLLIKKNNSKYFFAIFITKLQSKLLLLLLSDCSYGQSRE